MTIPLAGLIRGWGNYYAYAAESRLMDSLDGFIYREIWSYCRRKQRELGAKAVYRMYTLPPHLREVGYFHLGVVIGEQAVRIPRLSSIPRKPLRLGYPPHPYLGDIHDSVLPAPGSGDECWWDQHIWAGQEGDRIGQRRLATAVRTRTSVCEVCGTQLVTEVHHDPPWHETHRHRPQQALALCVTCHRRLHGAAG